MAYADVYKHNEQLLNSANLKKQKGERKKTVDAINAIFDRFQGMFLCLESTVHHHQQQQRMLI